MDEEVPGLERLPHMDEQGERGHDQKKGRQNHADLADRLEPFHPENKGQGGQHKRPGAQPRQIKIDRDQGPESLLGEDVVEDAGVHLTPSSRS